MPAIAAVGQVAITNGVIGVDYIGGNYVPIYGNSDLLASPRITPPGTTTTTNIRNATGIYQSLIIAFNTPAVVSNLSVFDHNTGVYLINTAQVGATPTIVPLPADAGAGYDVTVTVSSGGQSYYIFGSRLPMHQAVSNVGQTPLTVQGAVQVATASGQFVNSRNQTAPLGQLVTPAVAGSYSLNVSPDAGAQALKIVMSHPQDVTLSQVRGTTTLGFYYNVGKGSNRPIYVPIPSAYDTSFNVWIGFSSNTAHTMWVEEIFSSEVPAITSNHPSNLSYVYNSGLINSATMFGALSVPFGVEGWDLSASILVPPGSAAGNENVLVSYVGDTTGAQLILGCFALACPAVAAGGQGITLSDSKTVHLGAQFIDTQSIFAGDATLHLLLQYGAFQPAIGLAVYPT